VTLPPMANLAPLVRVQVRGQPARRVAGHDDAAGGAEAVGLDQVRDDAWPRAAPSLYTHLYCHRLSLTAIP
jgi:hypothetical protein